MIKNNLTKRSKSVQLYKDSGSMLLERFYKTLETGLLIDPVALPSSDEYYIWVKLKEKFPDITLGEACEALNLEGYTDYVGMLKSTIDESDSA